MSGKITDITNNDKQMDRIDWISEQMIILVSWKIEHEYFKDKECRCVELFPDPPTQALLKRRMLIFKRLGVNHWVLIGKKSTIWDFDDVIVLKVKINDLFFGYYTENSLPDHLFWQPGMPQQFCLNCKVKILKWEYVILMKEWREGRQFKLTETEGKLEFKSKRSIRLNGLEGICMESEEVVKLQEEYDYQIHLSEKKSFGYKMIYRQLPWPVPGYFPECAPGCIRGVLVV